VHLKVLNGRAATSEDAEKRSAFSYIPDSSSVPFTFDRSLPLKAVLTKPDDGDGFPPPGSLVYVVQAEIGDNGEVVIGLMYGDDQEALCLLRDITIILEDQQSPAVNPGQAGWL
jgi:hypothetical protein